MNGLAIRFEIQFRVELAFGETETERDLILSGDSTKRLLLLFSHSLQKQKLKQRNSSKIDNKIELNFESRNLKREVEFANANCFYRDSQSQMSLQVGVAFACNALSSFLISFEMRAKTQNSKLRCNKAQFKFAFKS